MCLLIAKDEGTTVEKAELEKAFAWHRDGAGFAAFHDGKVVMKKGFFTFNWFWQNYEPFAKDRAIVHFRQCSCGMVNKTNCHPFEVGEGNFLAHNGHMSEFDPGDRLSSDTRYFAEEVLSPLIQGYPRFLYEWGTLELLDLALSLEKVAIIRNDGKLILFNKKSWREEKHKEGSVFFSNLQHRYVFNRLRGQSYVYTSDGGYRYSSYSATEDTEEAEWRRYYLGEYLATGQGQEAEQANETSTPRERLAATVTSLARWQQGANTAPTQEEEEEIEVEFETDSDIPEGCDICGSHNDPHYILCNDCYIRALSA